MRLCIAALLFSATACSSPDLEPYGTCESTAEDDGAPEPGLAAELLVPNVDIGVEWYRDLAGFELLYNAAAKRSCFAALELEGGTVLLSHSSGAFDPPDNAIELRFIVEDSDAQWERFKDADVEVVREIDDAEYGMREFVVRDVYGFRVRFATPL